MGVSKGRSMAHGGGVMADGSPREIVKDVSMVLSLSVGLGSKKIENLSF